MDLKRHPNMNESLQQSKLRLLSMPLNEIGYNSSDFTELRAKKCQQLEPISKSNSSCEIFNDDNEHEKSANKIGPVFGLPMLPMDRLCNWVKDSIIRVKQ
ncbi:37903_t:CDS:2, partial [Gigaspora margarita]